MKIIYKSTVISILLISMYISCASTEKVKQTSSLDNFYTNFISYIKTNLPNDYDLDLAVISFESTKDRDQESIEFGQYLAETIASHVGMNIPESTLYERENLEVIIEEHNLNLSGYIDSNQAKEIGKIIPVNTLLTGKYTILDDTVTINCRLIDVTTGKILITYYESVMITKDIGKIIGKEVIKDEPIISQDSEDQNSNNESITRLDFNSSDFGMLIKYKEITIDGKRNDWDEIEPIELSKLDGNDYIERFYVAQNEEFLFLRLDVNDQVELYGTDNSPFLNVGYSSEGGDLQFGYMFNGKSYSTLLNQMLVSNGNNSQWNFGEMPRGYCSMDETLEFKIKKDWFHNNSPIYVKAAFGSSSKGDLYWSNKVTLNLYD